MGRAGRGRAESGCNGGLQIMQTPCWVVLGDVLGINRAIHLLIYLEILMDGVPGEGVERYVRRIFAARQSKAACS